MRARRDETTRYSRSRAAFARRSRAATPRALAIALVRATRDSRDRARASRARRAQTLPFSSVAVDQSFRARTRDLALFEPIVSRLCLGDVRSHVMRARSGRVIQNADARSLRSDAARVAEADFRAAAIVLELYRSMRVDV